MTAQPQQQTGGRVRHVGRVLTELTITNRADESAAERGYISSDAVRSVMLHGVLVDTGANTLCLPKSLVAKLGLAHFRTAVARTAAGEIDVEIFRDASINVMGRIGTFECVQLPDDAEPLLGLLPLEGLGLEPDLHNETLRMLPDFGPRNFRFIY
jgi:predicted aspartyl protease